MLISQILAMLFGIESPSLIYLREFGSRPEKRRWWQIPYIINIKDRTLYITRRNV